MGNLRIRRTGRKEILSGRASLAGHFAADRLALGLAHWGWLRRNARRAQEHVIVNRVLAFAKALTDMDIPSMSASASQLGQRRGNIRALSAVRRAR